MPLGFLFDFEFLDACSRLGANPGYLGLVLAPEPRVEVVYTDAVSGQPMFLMGILLISALRVSVTLMHFEQNRVRLELNQLY